MQNTLEIFKRLADPRSPEVTALLQVLSKNDAVQKSGISMHKKDFNSFARAFAKGLEYAGETYGEVSIPTHLHIGDLEGVQNGKPTIFNNFLSYAHEMDCILVSPLWIAEAIEAHRLHRQAPAGKTASMFNGKVGHKVGVFDFHTLAAVEECYHRYDHIVNGSNMDDELDWNTTTLGNREHPLEKNAEAPLALAAQDLNIHLMPA